MKKTKEWFLSAMLRGLSILLPVFLTIQLLIWLFKGAERITMTIAVDVFPWEFYIPGMGVLLLMTVVLLTGLLIYPWFSGKVDAGLRRVPLFGSVYSPLRDFMGLLGGGGSTKIGYPVMLCLPGTAVETLAFVTRDQADSLPDELIKAGYVVVYVQFASQLGGMSFVVPESSCRKLDVSSEDALKFALTAGISAPQRKN